MSGLRAIAAHIVIFAFAILVVCARLGIGPSLNPAIGTTLWLAAGLIATLNFIWMSRPASSSLSPFGGSIATT